jgi:hypothetical protein
MRMPKLTKSTVDCAVPSIMLSGGAVDRVAKSRDG